MPSDAAKVRAGRTRAIKAMNKLESDFPTIKNQESKEPDREQAFILYATFCGDVERTAHALDLQPKAVLEMAREGEWQERLSAIIELRETKRPGDVERGINRALNFAQAQEMRKLVQRMMQNLAQMTNKELVEFCMSVVKTTNKDGTVTEERRLGTRPFADLASALEKVHMMSYYALTDTAAERGRRSKEGPDKASLAQMEAAIREAVTKAAGQSSPQAKLTAEQTARGESLAKQNGPPSAPG
jgi:hypothetical protein